MTCSLDWAIFIDPQEMSAFFTHAIPGFQFFYNLLISECWQLLLNQHLAIDQVKEMDFKPVYVVTSEYIN